MVTIEHPLSDWNCVGTHMPDHSSGIHQIFLCVLNEVFPLLFSNATLPRIISSPIHVNPHRYPQPHGCSRKAQNKLSGGQALFCSFGCSSLSLNSTEPSALFRAHVFAHLKQSWILQLRLGQCELLVTSSGTPRICSGQPGSTEPSVKSQL